MQFGIYIFIPASVLKPQASLKKISVNEYIDKLIELFKNHPSLEMISFTDHNIISIDVYKRFYSKKTNIKLIPGIEIDINLDSSPDVKHLIVYFNLNEKTLNRLQIH